MNKKQNLDILFERLFTIFSSRRFLLSEGTAGEIPFYIQTFAPSVQVDLDKQVSHLVKRLDSCNVRVLEINLYHFYLDLLKTGGHLEMVFEFEKTNSKAELLDALNSVLTLEHDIVPAMANLLNTADYHIFFITGVGAIYPIIRSHTILNNLQKLVKAIPLVMFFPGKYDNLYLKLFDRMRDDNYYRAFNLNEFRV